MTHDHKPPSPPTLISIAAALAREGRGAEAKAVRDAAEAIKIIVKLAPPLECADFHHDKPDFHTGHNCPIEKRWAATLSKLDAAKGPTA